MVLQKQDYQKQLKTSPASSAVVAKCVLLAIKSQTTNSSMFAPTMFGSSNIGGQTQGKGIHVLAINNKRQDKRSIGQSIW